MQGVTGWKRVLRFSRNRHAAPVSADGATVQSLPVDEGFEDMRQDRGRQRTYQKMRAEPAYWFFRSAGEQPADHRGRYEQVLVCAPCQKLGASLDRNVGMPRNVTRDVLVELCRPNGNKSHRCDHTGGPIKGTQGVKKGSYLHRRLTEFLLGYPQKIGIVQT